LVRYSGGVQKERTFKRSKRRPPQEEADALGHLAHFGLKKGLYFAVNRRGRTLIMTAIVLLVVRRFKNVSPFLT